MFIICILLSCIVGTFSATIFVKLASICCMFQAINEETLITASSCDILQTSTKKTTSFMQLPCL